MNTKILRHRNLLGCIFAIFLTLPMLNVLARVLYTQWNKEAYQSYSGQVSDNVTYEEITDLSTFEVGKSYYFNANTFSISTVTSTTNFYFYFDDIDIVFTSVDFINNQTRAIRLTKNANQANTFIVLTAFDENNTHMGSTTLISGSSYLAFYFTYLGNTNPSNYSLFTQLFYEYTEPYEINSTLDNAFEYSINKITDNNLGNIQFFTWFADLFVDLTKPQNALYVNFINWYFNYALLVSVAYILFLVLMWFIQFIRKLLEKGMDFGQRGY